MRQLILVAHLGMFVLGLFVAGTSAQESVVDVYKSPT